jgi:hypothetical protein
MKEYRIISLNAPAVINVRHKGKNYPYTGYTDKSVAEKDCAALRRAYPSRTFEVVNYEELEIEAGGTVEAYWRLPADDEYWERVDYEYSSGKDK